MARTVLGKVVSKAHPGVKGSYGRQFVGYPCHRTGEFRGIPQVNFSGFVSLRDVAIGCYEVVAFRK